MVEEIIVIPEKCKGCKLCVPACPFGAIEIVNKLAIINDKCTLCGACVGACKFEAINITVKREAPKIDLSLYKGIWVFAQQSEGIIDPVSYELIGKANELAQTLDEEVCAILLGHKNIEMTMKYSHLSPEHKKIAVNLSIDFVDRNC